jgi:hypothetical protein
MTDTLKAFGVFFIGFIARPIGRRFRHYGDRSAQGDMIVTC